MKSKFLLLAILGFTTVPATAQDVAGALARCASVGEEHARLACYDRLSAEFKQVTAPILRPTAPETSAAAPVSPQHVSPPTVTPKVADFGAESIHKAEPTPGAPEDVDEIKATIAKVELSPSNRFTVTLDNGQVWRQIQADTRTAHFRASGDAVTISRGVFGSYNLSLDGRRTGLFKVHRIR